MSIAGKVALVMGGARGIGFAIAQRLVQEKAAVGIVDINSTGGQEALRATKALGVQATSSRRT